MSQPNDAPNPFDPLSFWRTTQNASLDAWSKAMIELVNTDAYADATGRMLDSYLAASVPMRKMVEQSMTQVLGQINIPTRSEVLSIAERMTNIEMRLDDLDARFDDIQRLLAQIASQTAQTARDAQEPPAPLASDAKSQRKSTTTAPAAAATRPRRARAATTSTRSTAASRSKE